MSLFRYAIVFCIALFSMPTFAQGTNWFVGGSAQWYSYGGSPESICEQYHLNIYPGLNPTGFKTSVVPGSGPYTGQRGSPYVTWGRCYIQRKTDNYNQVVAIIQYLQCPAGTTFDPSTGMCLQPCQSGIQGTVNLGVGYAKTTKNVDDWISPVFHSTSCSSACQVSVGDVVPGSCYVAPTVGPPYAGYCEFSTITTGVECTGSDEASTQALPPIQCPSGTQSGSVNGVTGCYAVSTAETTKSTVTNPDGSTTTTETTTSNTGTTTTTTTCDTDGSCTSTTSHVGGGGSSGAPATSGQPYDGQPDGQEDGKPCGAPGQPKCDVKVDEEGTPTEAPPSIAQAYGEALAAVDNQMEYLAGSGWIKEELPFFWNPTLPNSTCSAFQIYGHTLDICSTADLVRNIWSYCFLFMTALYIWSRATNVNKGA